MGAWSDQISGWGRESARVADRQGLSIRTPSTIDTGWSRAPASRGSRVDRRPCWRDRRRFAGPRHRWSTATRSTPWGTPDRTAAQHRPRARNLTMASGTARSSISSVRTPSPLRVRGHRADTACSDAPFAPLYSCTDCEALAHVRRASIARGNGLLLLAPVLLPDRGCQGGSVGPPAFGAAIPNRDLKVGGSTDGKWTVALRVAYPPTVVTAATLCSVSQRVVLATALCRYQRWHAKK